ncbi:AT hook motif family protein [Glarea lozoyensis ATCC 20868]|uniref:AT hook motif family protein n=1 Tax=Glarea lozoyensis (strain ATCC 20868 / MF5171) TaxID=1116229 RepID=S3CXZ0_GLAL2|nr:AT hook motif family protein [Glarea lozoyensis ATCC 20868]EPE29789.1 AT hook motif family protein [Glarea lozoyensis ATCC 20868]
MSSYNDEENAKHGFTCSYGRFYTFPGRVERVEASSLRSMFLPKLTAEANKKLKEGRSGNFVRGQLKHYGVKFDESEMSGNGTPLMKKVLQAGKCDKVPDHITRLREQLHAEWLNKQTPEQLSSFPDWVMEKYFLSSGQPDRKKTATVVASKVAGLHNETGRGPKTQTIFMGWNSAAVKKAAKDHPAKEAKEVQAEGDEREDQREEMHTDYLNTQKQKKGPKSSKRYSPVGSYIIDCKEIEEQWPDQAEDLSLDIRQTEEPGIFEASFNFGILEGVMIIGAEKKALEQYCSQLDLEDESDLEEEEDEEEDKDDDEDEDESENEKKRARSSKRKSEAPRGRGRPPKKSKSEPAQSRTYLLRLKCRETGEGEIQSEAEQGTITFKDGNLASFTGKATLPCVGEAIPFSGRKISDTPAAPESSWADFSENAYEDARVGRWH